MSLIHTRTFRVRHYECDAYGHLSNVNYLRYMQEAAFAAADAVGYGLRYCEAEKRVWLIRETDIEYQRPLHYGDSVTVRTWVEDLRRSRSRRAYEFINDSGGEACPAKSPKGEQSRRVARATTDWVYVDADTLRPVAVPPEIMAAFGLSPDQTPTPRSKFPTAPPPPPPGANLKFALGRAGAKETPPGVFKMRRQAQFREIDALAHVNNAVYLDYVSDCGMQAGNACGWTLARMREAGFGIYIKRHQIEYRQSALLDDELEVSTWLSAVRPASATRHYLIHRVRDGELLVRVHSQCVWIDLATGAPRRPPPGFLAALAPNIVSSAI